MSESAFIAYERIQAFKASRTAVLDGVNYANVVAPFLYDESLLGFVKKLIFSLLFSTHTFTQQSGGNGLLLFYSCRHKRRADYDYIPRRLRELLGERCEYIEAAEIFSLTAVLLTLREIPSAWYSSRGYRANSVQRLGCALLIAKYRSMTRRTFASLLHGKRKLVTFCDAQAPENLLAQMANASGIETFTTQHGQYRILDASNMSPDAEVYANFVSNYMLCWGEATRNEFVRIGFRPEQFIITGWIKQWTETLPHPRRGIFGVMLNGESGRSSNMALLDAAKTIAESLNNCYIVRLHPWSRPKSYSRLLDSRCVGISHYGLPSYLEQVDFSLAHMTGATIEILHNGAFVYLLDDEKLAEVFCVEGLCFKSAGAIASAAYKDMSSSAQGFEKNKRLCKWFNDDDEQAAHILAVLFG